MGGLKRIILTSVWLPFLLIPFAAGAQAAVPATLPPPSQTEADPTPTPAIQRDYALGDSGEDVYAFKLRLQELGYFEKDATLSDEVTKLTLKRVNALLDDNGMEAVDVITTEIQAMIFGEGGLAAIPTPAPSPTPQPLIAPVGTPELPQLTAEGFLADADGEYVFADDADGLWYYISDTLYVNIRRYNDREEENIWFETEVKTRGDEQIQSFHEDTMKVYQTPIAIARANRAVLAFTDDFFTKRDYGVIIRDGDVIRNKRQTSASTYPLGDTLAILADGSMKAFDYWEYNAAGFLAMGAVDVLSFGPWLLKDGEINPRVLTGTYMQYHEPRCALGMIEPGHYFILTVDGRYAGAVGAYFSWLAQRMREVGVTEALNLDGGGTTALVFMGTQISRASAANTDGTEARRVCSLLGFGVSDAVPD
jgi:hypothetical protein